MAFTFFIIFTFLVLPIASETMLSTYIVHVDTKTRPSHYLTHDEWYNSMVVSILIKSALMTTATVFDNAQLPIINNEDMELATPISTGAGHVNPESAIDPGLIYDADTSDYINLLCCLNYTEKQMKIFTNKANPCSGSSGTPLDLNYPSFSVMFRPDSSVHVVKRTLTHVVVTKPEEYRVKIVNQNTEKISIKYRAKVIDVQ